MPASSRASRSGLPSSCASSMKSKSTMTWLTMTPMRLAMPRNAMNPKGARTTARLASAPTTPKGMAAKTMKGLMALLNSKTSAT